MGFSSALSIAFEGLRANFWGLGCPAYCTQPSVGLVLCSYLLGLLSERFPSFWPSGVSVFPSGSSESIPSPCFLPASADPSPPTTTERLNFISSCQVGFRLTSGLLPTLLNLLLICLGILLCLSLVPFLIGLRRLLS